MNTRGTFPDDEQESPQREQGFWWGTVADNVDPEQRGRVRVNIPGLLNGPSTWAEAVGHSGQGGPIGTGHGSFATPKVGANVVVGFIQGDLDEPFYLGGPPPIGGVPDGGSNPNSHVIAETDTFRVVILEDVGGTKLRIETRLADKTADQRAAAQTYIEMNVNAGTAGRGHAISIHAASALKLSSSGGITIDAPVVNIKGRPVDPAKRSL